MKFQTKIIICVTMLLALTFAGGGSVLILTSFQDSLKREEEADLYTFQMVVYSLEALTGPDESSINSDMHNVLYHLNAQSDRWKAVQLSKNNSVIYANSSTAFSNSNEPIRKNKCSLQILSENKEHFLQISGIFSAQGDDYRLDMLFSLEDIYHSRTGQINNYQRIFSVVVLLGALVAVLTAGWLTRPLRELSITLQHITEGEYSCRAIIRSNDEIGQLASDLNKMTDRLEGNIQELEDSMNRKEEFMGSFAHELKTPMTAIIGYADLLRGQKLTEQEQQAAANYIFHESRRLESLSIKLLDLIVSKQKEFSLLPCEPAVLVNEALNILQPSLFARKISIDVKTASGSCLLERDLTVSLLVNLIDNSRKAMEEGGTIEIRQTMTDDGCRFFIKDTGCGMDPSEIKRITEPFYRIDKSRSRKQGGAGLGLALCMEIVNVHHGSVDFESEPGKGTAVTIELRGGRS